MKRRRQVVRTLGLSSVLETFFIASITSILVIRLFLAATGYPQLGGQGLHIAHMLWGGLLMMIALVLLLAFIGRHIAFSAALLGGIGFGTFIDELGKFITSDNNYFFQPTIALLYVIFVLLFLSFRELERGSSSSQQERLANALYLLAQTTVSGLHEEDKTEILLLLRAHQAHEPGLRLLAEAVEHLPVVPPSKPGPLRRIAETIRSLFVRLVHSPHFASIIIGCFIGYALLFLALMVFGFTHIRELAASSLTQGTVQFGLFASTIVSSILIVIGVVFLRRWPLRAYEWFKRAILVSICLTQFFLFYTQQWGALGALTLNLLVLATLNSLIHNKQQEDRQALLKQTYT